jgi:hypothetical protein
MPVAPRLIEVSIHDVKQLFNSMDPSPFHERDLDDDADAYIESWAREYSLDAPLKLRVHLEEWPEGDPEELIADAVHHYYAYRAGLAALDFRRIMKEGRATLAIGLIFLAVCLVSSRAIVARSDSDWAGYLSEGLLIVGWVAMWRPLETYLYDWWPVRLKRLIYTKLSVMPVEVVPKKQSR